MSELTALDENMAIQALGTQSAPPPGPQQAHGLYVEFYMHPQQNHKESEKAGRPIFEEIPYIMIMVPGDKSSIVRRPVRTGQSPKHDNNRFYNEYVAFMQKKDQPIQGTMLAEWPQVTRAQVLEMEYLGIRTVEQLANLNDAHAQSFMGMNDLKNKAKNWLEFTKDQAPLTAMQAELEERDNRIAAQADAIEDLQKQLLKLQEKGGKKEE